MPANLKIVSVNNSQFDVLSDGQVIGKGGDSCCSSFVRLKGFQQININNAKGQGGFIKKGEYFSNFAVLISAVLSDKRIEEKVKTSGLNLNKEDFININDYIKKI